MKFEQFMNEVEKGRWSFGICELAVLLSFNFALWPILLLMSLKYGLDVNTWPPHKEPK